MSITKLHDIQKNLGPDYSLSAVVPRASCTFAHHAKDGGHATRHPQIGQRRQMSMKLSLSRGRENEIVENAKSGPCYLRGGATDTTYSLRIR
jgi:hypothetical protein